MFSPISPPDFPMSSLSHLHRSCQNLCGGSSQIILFGDGGGPESPSEITSNHVKQTELDINCLISLESPHFCSYLKFCVQFDRMSRLFVKIMKGNKREGERRRGGFRLSHGGTVAPYHLDTVMISRVIGFRHHNNAVQVQFASCGSVEFFIGALPSSFRGFFKLDYGYGWRRPHPPKKIVINRVSISSSIGSRCPRRVGRGVIGGVDNVAVRFEALPQGVPNLPEPTFY